MTISFGEDKIFDPGFPTQFSAVALQEIVAQRLAAQNKRAVGLRLEELMKDTKFTKEEIRMMYRGFKQVSCFWYRC